MATPAKPRKPAARAVPGAYRVRDLDQVKALSHPLRLRLLEAFALKPSTTKQVAQLLGEKPTRLYHHVEALAKAGLVRLKETRPNRGTTEKYFEAVARRMEVDGSLFSPGLAATDDAASAMARTVLDSTRAELVDHIRHGRPQPRGQEPIVGRMTILGSPQDVADVRRRVVGLIGRSEALKRGRRAGRKGPRWILTVAFYPLPDDEDRET